MQETEFVFNLLYILLCFSIIYPPTEFVAAGFTIEEIFSKILGVESFQFVHYHIRRSCVTLIVHSVLPLIYIGVYFTNYKEASTNELLETFWSFLITASLFLPIFTLFKIYYWQKNHWNEHPICKTLKKFSNNNQSWRSVADAINADFRRPDKYFVRLNAISNLIATENWIIKTSPYKLYIAHQSDTALIIDKSDTHDISQHSLESVQFLNIQIKPTRPTAEQFSIRVKSTDFQDLQNRINRPITILASVKFHATVIDKFVEVFKEQITLNPKYQTSENLETCFACMLVQPNIKIQKNCLDNAAIPQSERCRDCFCRPMWCDNCLGKWFASRQDENTKERWLENQATCPMCRAPFCILDVSYIEKTNAAN